MNHTAAVEPKRKTGSIHVCPLSAVSLIVTRASASRLITCLQHEIPVATPGPISPERHLRLLVHDISSAMPGCVAPDWPHMAQLIEFAHAWGGEGDLVVHCWAGISRSTAAAFTALCAINPEVSEAAIAARLRGASATAQPNRLMVRLADALLNREGRMVRAIQAMSPAVFASEAAPFVLAANQAASGGAEAPTRGAENCHDPGIAPHVGERSGH